MEILKSKQPAGNRVLKLLLISAALASAVSGQVPRQLEVAVGSKGQVRIIASDVSYGDVLRALQEKLAWDIDIPSEADKLKLSFIRVDTTEPQLALVKLLEGSTLGYAFRGEVPGSHRMKVLIIPSAQLETKVTRVTASIQPIPGNPITEAPLPIPDQEQAVASQTNATTEETALLPALVPSTMSMADAINAIGAPEGMSPADVGRAMTFSMSEAARVMGVPPGVAPQDVGKTITLPLPTGPGKRP